MARSHTMAIEKAGDFFRLFVPPDQAADRRLAESLPHWRWNPVNKSLDFPACRESLEAICSTFASRGLPLASLAAEQLPTLPEWIVRCGMGAGRYFAPSSTAMLKPGRRGERLGRLCTVEEVRLNKYGRLVYTIRSAGRRLRNVDAGAIGDPRDFLSGDSAGRTAAFQLEIPWSVAADPGRAPANLDITPVLREAEAQLLEYFRGHPDRLGEIGPADFEKLIVAIYRGYGFAVAKVGKWNQADGGVDIIAVQKAVPLGEVRLAIQCKQSRYGISARPIRELQGVLDRFRAHKGVLCTTAWFTTHAISETQLHFWRVTLENRDTIYAKLRQLQV